MPARSCPLHVAVGRRVRSLAQSRPLGPGAHCRGDVALGSLAWDRRAGLPGLRGRARGSAPPSLQRPGTRAPRSSRSDSWPRLVGSRAEPRPGLTSATNRREGVSGGPAPVAAGRLTFVISLNLSDSGEGSGVSARPLDGERLLRPRCLEVDQPGLDPGVSLLNPQTLLWVAVAPEKRGRASHLGADTHPRQCRAESPKL